MHVADRPGHQYMTGSKCVALRQYGVDQPSQGIELALHNGACWDPVQCLVCGAQARQGYFQRVQVDLSRIEAGIGSKAAIGCGIARYQIDAGRALLQVWRRQFNHASAFADRVEHTLWVNRLSNRLAQLKAKFGFQQHGAVSENGGLGARP